MDDFSSISTCSVIPSGFRIISYTKTTAGVFADDGTRTGTTITYTIEGEIEALTAAALTSALAALQATCEAPAANFSISTFGAVREQLLLADCLSGPKLSYQYSGEHGATVQGITLTVEAVKAGGAGILASTEAVRTAENAEGLQVVTLSGTILTTGSPPASNEAATYCGQPAPAGWQQSYSYQGNADETQATYEITRTQLVAVYPTGGDPVLDGEYTINTTYDAHNRKITVHNYDYRGLGAAAYVEAQHTALRAAGGLMRASVTVTTHKTRQATATFEILAERITDDFVLELAETISSSRSGPLLSERRYSGTTPLVVQESEPAYVYVQAGRAVGLEGYPQPPAYKFADTNLATAPEITFARHGDREFETSWRFTFLFAAEQTQQFPSARTDSPGYYT